MSYGGKGVVDRRRCWWRSTRFCGHYCDLWKHVYDNLIHWYGVADSKSLGIITVNGLLFSLVTLGSIIGIGIGNNNSNNKLTDQNPALFYSLVAFLISTICSVVFSIWALWAQIENKPSIIVAPKKRPTGKLKKYELPKSMIHLLQWMKK